MARPKKQAASTVAPTGAVAKETITVKENLPAPSDQQFPKIEDDAPEVKFSTAKNLSQSVRDEELSFYEKKETSRINDTKTLHLVKVNGVEMWWPKPAIIQFSRRHDPAGRPVEIIGDGSRPKGSFSLEFPRNTEIVLEPATKRGCRGCL